MATSCPPGIPVQAARGGKRSGPSPVARAGNDTNTLILIHIPAGGKKSGRRFRSPRDDWVHFAGHGRAAAARQDRPRPTGVSHVSMRRGICGKRASPPWARTNWPSLVIEAGRYPRPWADRGGTHRGAQSITSPKVNMGRVLPSSRNVFGGGGGLPQASGPRRPTPAPIFPRRIPAPGMPPRRLAFRAPVRMALPNGDLDRTHRQQAFPRLGDPPTAGPKGCSAT